jgi:hypothetical protein
VFYIKELLDGALGSKHFKNALFLVGKQQYTYLNCSNCVNHVSTVTKLLFCAPLIAKHSPGRSSHTRRKCRTCHKSAPNAVSFQDEPGGRLQSRLRGSLEAREIATKQKMQG